MFEEELAQDNRSLSDVHMEERTIDDGELEITVTVEYKNKSTSTPVKIPKADVERVLAVAESRPKRSGTSLNDPPEIPQRADGDAMSRRPVAKSRLGNRDTEMAEPGSNPFAFTNGVVPSTGSIEEAPPSSKKAKTSSADAQSARAKGQAALTKLFQAVPDSEVPSPYSRPLSEQHTPRATSTQAVHESAQRLQNVLASTGLSSDHESSAADDPLEKMRRCILELMADNYATLEPPRDLQLASMILNGEGEEGLKEFLEEAEHAQLLRSGYSADNIVAKLLKLPQVIALRQASESDAAASTATAVAASANEEMEDVQQASAVAETGYEDSGAVDFDE
ncbi:hypothetical protein Slin14017_G116610 [Septoria linicola]|nr:hypothetical protein Slin14017_G116610 [Septoria linicola]